MFDTMTLTKIVGSFCGALLIFLLGSWAAEEIYHVGGHGDGHDGEITQAYSIPVEDDGAEAEAEPEVPFEEVFASADAGAGERVFGKCRACHQINGTDAVGPHLNGVVGREVASVGGFNYSGALGEQAEAWDPEVLNAFLIDPQGWAPGTTMSFNGLPNIEDRANLIAYLDSLEG
ncbi:Cytochrome c-552 [Rhodobacteraceae bacterium THAF1]|uniref:c-type cytochrome n=1 Tax=Palleronia sp. THAF1 TaxID=2587842 RepID=UPI000F40934D|nr:cytochrome c family protein [Palleronia sp. THAF1]QFU07603.1 Cytochrome c-552 [Palleronia sp. THAF1]VDC22825.1 Cytochrome c-552 [Rhodobacteraceae bacterium THAF1]